MSGAFTPQSRVLVLLMMIRTMEREPVRCVVVVVKFETGSGFCITGYKIVNTDLIF